MVPGATTVLLDGVADPDRVASEIATWSVPPLNGGPATTVEILCRYDGPDLADVAHHWGVKETKVVSIHASLSHRVAFCGFSPGFAYIDGLGERWQVPRAGRPAPGCPGWQRGRGWHFHRYLPPHFPGRMAGNRAHRRDVVGPRAGPSGPARSRHHRALPARCDYGSDRA